MPAGISFSQLTVIIHTVMGWSGYHLSEYTFTNLHFKLKEEVTADDWLWDFSILDSSEYIIDGFFSRVKSFTYLYDFGDNWSHEVKIEDVIEDYDGNCPIVLKYKENTPPEDCGGIWGYADMLDTLSSPKKPDYKEIKEWFDDNYKEYDLAQVNTKLSKMVVTGKKIKPVSESGLLEKQFKGSYQLDKVKGKEAPKNSLDAKAKYYENLSKIAKEIGLGASNSNRMGLSDEEIDLLRSGGRENEPDFNYDLDQYEEVEIVPSNDSMQDYMLNLTEKDIDNYLKYLQISGTKYEKKLSKIKTILEFLYKRPEYYLYVIEKEPIEVLFDIFDYKTKDLGFGDYISDAVYDAIQISAMLGFLKVKGKGKKCTLLLADDACDLINKIKAVDSAKVYSKLAKIDKYLGAIVRYYGFIEIDEAIDMTRAGINDKETDLKEYKRMVYWHVRMLDYAQTGYNTLTQETFVFAPGYPAQQIMEYRQKNDIDNKLNYYPLDFNNPATFDYNVANNFTCWEYMAEFLEGQLALESFEIEDFINEIFFDVVNGKGSSFIYDILKKEYPEKNPFVLSMYWHVSFACAGEMALPHLKGYSRLDYYRKFGEYPDNLAMSEKTLHAQKITRKSELTLFPEEDQWKIFSLLDTDNLKNHKEKMLETIDYLLDKYEDNLYLLATLPEVLMALDERERAKETLQKIRFMDHSLEKQIKTMLSIVDSGAKLPYFEQGPFDDYDYFDYVPQEPVRRDRPTVGRNDSCPCGSGKKFKKCCMGKGIFD